MLLALAVVFPTPHDYNMVIAFKKGTRPGLYPHGEFFTIQKQPRERDCSLVVVR